MDLLIGQKAERSITLTAEHVKTFADLSGDTAFGRCYHRPLYV